MPPRDDRGHRVRRADALHRGLRVEGRSSDGRRHRACGHRSGRRHIWSVAVARRREPGRPRRHDEGGDDGRRGVPEGARRVPFAGASAVERVRPAPRPGERVVPARGRRFQRAGGVEPSAPRRPAAGRRCRAQEACSAALRKLGRRSGCPAGSPKPACGRTSSRRSPTRRWWTPVTAQSAAVQARRSAVAVPLVALSSILARADCDAVAGVAA